MAKPKIIYDHLMTFTYYDQAILCNVVFFSFNYKGADGNNLLFFISFSVQKLANIYMFT